LKVTRIAKATLDELLQAVVNLIAQLGHFVLMLWKVMVGVVTPPFRFGEVLRQLDFVGVQSVALIVFTGAFTGMVSALQTYNGVSRFGAHSMVGATVALGLTRELGPVLSSLMVIGRAVSAMAAELGTMRTTQQIDALRSMAVNPIHYLVVPRVLATVLALPVLALFFSFSGIVSAYFMSIHQLGLDESAFVSSIKTYLAIEDVTHGLTKCVIFGLVISLIGCNEGYNAKPGAKGVASATTTSVVTSSVTVLILDYVITSFLYGPGS
jgi:phospholipid/cholesterol/gamma-HCH transport system permease protein